MVENLYVHFPFCRRKCSYCTLYSRTGVAQADRDAYVRALAEELKTRGVRPETLKTIYFGGGSPALCDLTPLLTSLHPQPSSLLAPSSSPEFTVELHPLDVTDELLKRLRDGGVNRISMGVQSLDDGILSAMGRGYTFAEAERAFYRVKEHFENAGIDLIVGYPGETAALTPRHARLAKWGLKHCSVYALQNERGLKGVVDDETVMNRLATTAAFMKDIGLERYEISNYAVPGYECRHNLAVWRGEDYVGLGEGACGRIGRDRTRNGKVVETVSPEKDEIERRIFRLRTTEGLDASGHPEWGQTLEKGLQTGLLVKSGDIYRLTARGLEVCDSILLDLV